MTVAEYQIGAGNTDEITEQQFKMHYYRLGACGELAELKEKVLKLELNQCSAKDAMYELGDLTWYLMRDLKALEGSITYDVRDVDEISLEEVKLDIPRLDCDVDAICVLIGANADITKKMIRDNNNIYTEEIKNKLVDNIKKAFNICASASAHLGLVFSLTLSFNLAKLASRKDRNKIHGSGDNR